MGKVPTYLGGLVTDSLWMSCLPTNAPTQPHCYYRISEWGWTQKLPTKTALSIVAAPHQGLIPKPFFAIANDALGTIWHDFDEWLFVAIGQWVSR